MFRYAGSFLAVSVLLEANNWAIATESHTNVADENLLRVGTPNHRALGPQVFWSPVGQLLEGSEEGDNFGWGVAQSSNGKIIAVGAGDFDTDKKDVGKVQVYYRKDHKTRSEWLEMGDPILGEKYDRAGFSLKLSATGGIIAIGSEESNYDTGHVKVYQWKDRKGWIQLGNTIVGPDYGDGAGYGFDLSADGLTLAFGAPKHDKYGSNNGVTIVYQYDKETKDWEVKGHPIPGSHSHNSTDAYYGWSVGMSASGDRVLML